MDESIDVTRESEQTRDQLSLDLTFVAPEERRTGTAEPLEDDEDICAGGDGSAGRILVCDAFLPFFDRDSHAQRIYGLMRVLRSLGYNITFIARSDRFRDIYARLLERLGVQVYAGDPAAMKHAGSSLDGAQQIPYDVIFRDAFDCAIISGWQLGEYYLPLVRRLSPTTPVIIDSLGFEFQRAVREAESKGSDELLQLAHENLKWELAVYRRADRVWTAGEQDADAIRKAAPDVPVDVVPDITPLALEPKPWEERSDLLFVGNFNHKRNADAIVHFCAEILPLVAQEIPGIRLAIAGTDPSPEVQALASRNVTVTGYVPDLSEFLSGSRVAVSPAPNGAVSTGKVREALAWGLPVVTTEATAAELCLTPGGNVLVADDPQSFAAAVVELYNSVGLWGRLANAGREKASQWSRTTVKPKVQEILGEVTAPRDHLVSIVVTAAGHLAYTKRCLESIIEHTDVPYELVLVDNGSTDSTSAYFSEARQALRHTGLCTQASMIRHDGISTPAAMDSGIAASSGDCVVLMTNDTVVTPGWLRSMLNHAVQNPHAGLIGPVTNHQTAFQTARQISYDKLDLSGLNEFAAQWTSERAGRAVVARRLSGFCLMATRSMIEEIGGLDPRFRSPGFDDVDYCIRASAAGFRCIIALDAFVHCSGCSGAAVCGPDTEGLLDSWTTFKQKWSVPREMPLTAAASVLEILEQLLESASYYIDPSSSTNSGESSERWFAAPNWDDESTWQPVVTDYIRTHLPSDGSSLKLYAGELTSSSIEYACQKIGDFLAAMGARDEDIPSIDIVDAVPTDGTTDVILCGGSLDERLRALFPGRCIAAASWRRRPAA